MKGDSVSGVGGDQGAFGPGRFRFMVVLAAFSVLAAAGAATGSTPSQVVSAPVRFFFPSFGVPEVPAVTTTTQPACQPTASLRERAARVLIVGLPDVKDAAAPLPTELMQLGVGGVLITGGNVDTRVQAVSYTHLTLPTIYSV